jgi:hypothetical protein
LQELTQLLDLNWKMEERQIVIYQSQKINFTAFFNKDEPFQTNIENVILRTYARQINLAI